MEKEKEKRKRTETRTIEGQSLSFFLIKCGGNS